MPKPEKFKVGEVVRIKNLVAPDDIWNGTEAIVLSDPYTHPEHNMTIIDVQFDEITGWAIEPWNLEKISEEEYDSWVDENYLSAKRRRYMDPLGDGQPYDGRKVVKWSDCVWQPNPNFKRQAPT
jgi:hypothetical protein